jgi:hypothetical protein
VYGYNHMEAVACFHKVLAHDAHCAMAHWGIAYAAGPNYNPPWYLLDPAGRAQALAATYDAMQLQQTMGLSGFIIEPNVGGAIPPEGVDHAMKLFTQEVAPYLRGSR